MYIMGYCNDFLVTKAKTMCHLCHTRGEWCRIWPWPLLEKQVLGEEMNDSPFKEPKDSVSFLVFYALFETIKVLQV